MNQREITLLQSRLKYWKEILRHQHSLKKTERNQDSISIAKARIAILDQWLTGKKVAVPEERMTLEEFNEQMKEIVDTSKPAAVIELNTKEDVDRMWDRIFTANIQIKCPKDVEAYIREKMKEEAKRPYRFNNL